MMGHKGKGFYSPEAYDFTRSLEGDLAQNSLLLQKTLARMRSFGARGLASLYCSKLAYDFGDGAYAISDFLDDAPVEPNALHRYLLYSGERFLVYRYVCTAVLLCMFLFAAFGAFAEIITDRGYRVFTLRVSLMGLSVFLCLWESSARYFTNFAPIFLLLGALGAESLFRRT